MIEQASWLVQPIKGNRSKRLFGLPAPHVRDKKSLNLGENYLAIGAWVLVIVTVFSTPSVEYILLPPVHRVLYTGAPPVSPSDSYIF